MLIFYGSHRKLKEQLNRASGTIKEVIRGHSWCKNLAVAVLVGWENNILYFGPSLPHCFFKGRHIKKQKNWVFLRRCQMLLPEKYCFLRDIQIHSALWLRWLPPVINGNIPGEGKTQTFQGVFFLLCLSTSHLIPYL